MIDRPLQKLVSSSDYEAFCHGELADPYELLDRLRLVAPVHWSENRSSWFVTAYEQVTSGLKDKRLRHDRVRDRLPRNS
jgi:hypothetical protein